MELLPVDVVAFEVVPDVDVELGADVDPVVSVAVPVGEAAALVGVAVLDATTLSPFTCQPNTVRVELSGTTVDVMVHDTSLAVMKNRSCHVSDCWAVTVDVHSEGNVAFEKSGMLRL